MKRPNLESGLDVTEIANLLSARSMPEPNSGCVLWLGNCDTSGYGRIKRRYRDYATHRLAWLVAHGAPPTGLHVLHHCDVPSCINPRHLFLGVHADNMADKAQKGRLGYRFGEGQTQAKLTDAAVLSIRADLRSNAEIAAAHGISSSLVSLIRSGKRWRHVRSDEVASQCPPHR